MTYGSNKFSGRYASTTVPLRRQGQVVQHVHLFTKISRHGAVQYAFDETHWQPTKAEAFRMAHHFFDAQYGNRIARD